MKNTNEKHVKNLFEIHEWKLVRNEIYEEQNDSLICESLTSLGNGFFGTRGNFEETYTGHTHQGTYNAGIWFPDATKVGWWKNGYPLYFGKVINSINFIGIKVLVNGKELDLNKFKPYKFQQELDIQHGILSRNFEVEIDGVKLKCVTERFYSIYDSEMAFIKYKITPNRDCNLEYISYLDAKVKNLDSNYEQTFWEPFDNGFDKKSIFVGAKTKANPFDVERFTVLVAAKNICFADNVAIKNEPMHVGQKFSKFNKAGESFEINKVVSVLTTRTNQEKDLKEKALEKIENIDLYAVFEHGENHKREWLKRWASADIVIKGDKKAQQGIRYSLFQLFSTYYGENPNFNIGPKGFTGEKYGGATYWDTEAYCLPVYLALSPQHVSKNLLLYRYNQLEQAKHNARQQGLDGALYPMVTFNGIECHNEWEITFEEIHRNGIIAFAIYQYVNYTKDDSYIEKYGINVIIEIAKFFASRVHYSKEKKVYMIHGVTGPNEFENNVNNNWYTNKIAQWVINYALQLIKKYNIKLEDYKITEEDLKNWKNIVKKMYFNYDEQLKIFVQHDTFLDKEFIETKDLSSADRPLVHNWSWDKILRSCFIKQADVLQGMYLFQEEFSLEEIKNNFEFYEKYTVHESSLSSCIHSILAAKLNKIEKAYDLFQRASRLDLDNYNDDTKDGLHITSMAGSWMSIVEGFAGFRVIDSKLHLNPKLPKQWEQLSFNIIFQNRRIKVDISNKSCDLILLDGKPINLVINNQKEKLETFLKINL